MILQVALELFYTKGYDSVGVQEIAEHAKVTKPTLYYYFGSKIGLLREVLRKYSQHFIANLKKASVYENDLPLTLYKTALSYVTFAVENRKFYFFMLALNNYAKENEAYKEVAPISKEMNHLFLEIFEQATKELGNMNGRQQQFAIGFIGTMHYYILFASQESDGEEIVITKEQVHSLVHQFMHGIYS